MRVAFLVLALLCGCRGLGGTAYPLYPNLGPPPRPEDTARLLGPIATVDDQPVASKGQTFALLPGCHIVTMKKDIGAGSDNGAWAATFPALVYAFRMEAGHTYTVKAEISDSSGPVGWVRMVARDRAPDGRTVRWPLAGSQAELDECRRWTPPPAVSSLPAS